MTNETLNQKFDRLDAEYQDYRTELDTLNVQIAKLQRERNAILSDTQTLPSKLAKSAAKTGLEIKDAQFQANIYHKRVQGIETQLPEILKSAREAADEATIAEIHAREAYVQVILKEQADAIATVQQIAYSIKHVASHKQWDDIQKLVLGTFCPSNAEAEGAAESLELTGDIDMATAVVDRFNTSDQHDKARFLSNSIEASILKAEQAA